MMEKDGNNVNSGNNEKPRIETAAREPRRKTVPAKPAPVLRDVDSALSSRGFPRWACEGVKVFAGWKSGKMVSDEQIETAVDGWNKRRQGGGRR